MRTVVPLRERKLDIVFLGFFWFNLVFITYLFDLEQIVITDTSNFEYPVWPPAFIVDLGHWWGANFDPVLLERPVWWRMTIWIDAVLFGPFYMAAIYAFTKGKDWIRIPTVIFASVMLTNVTIILGEEFMGEFASPNILAVLGANASWVIVPILLIWRMWNAEHPFTEPTTE
jgi:hypothetical protein